MLLPAACGTRGIYRNLPNCICVMSPPFAKLFSNNRLQTDRLTMAALETRRKRPVGQARAMTRA